MDGAGALALGYYSTTPEWLPLLVDDEGRVQVDMSNINLDDLADTNVPTPTDQHVLTWDAATSKWISQAAAAGSLDDAYDQGATIDVDAYDIIFNLSSTYDFKIQDNGADVHVWSDDGKYTFTLPAALVTAFVIDGDTNPQTADAEVKIFDLDRTATIPASGNIQSHVAFDIDLDVTHPADASAAQRLYAFWLTPTLDVDSTATGFVGVTAEAYGLYALSICQGDTINWPLATYRRSYGFYSLGSILGDYNTSGGAHYADAYGVRGEAKTLNITLTGGALEVHAYGGFFKATGGTAGTHAATGMYAQALGADTNLSGYFFKNVAADTTPVVLIFQDAVSGACPCLTLHQDDISEGLIDFLGSARGAIAGATNSVESVRVELNGTIYRLALYADA